MAHPLQSGRFRAILGLPLVIVAGSGLFLTGLPLFFLGLLRFFPPYVALALLLGGVIAALGRAWNELYSEPQERISLGPRIAFGLILFLWLAVEIRRYPFEPSQTPMFFLARLLLSLLSDDDAVLKLRLGQFFREVEWITVAVSVWLFIELLRRPFAAARSDAVPTTDYSMRALLVMVVAGLAVGHVVLDRFVVGRFLASPGSLDYRAFHKGTIGEALCARNFAIAGQRIAAQGAALREDELTTIIGTCGVSWRLVIAPEDIPQRTQPIRMIAPLIVQHDLAIDAGGYCGKGSADLLELTYLKAFSADNLRAAKEGGLPLDCLKRNTDTRAPKPAAPIWWTAVDQEGLIDEKGQPYQNQHPEMGLGNAEDGKARLRVLKELGVDLRQKDAEGHNLLSWAYARSSSAWIEALLDEGLDLQQPARGGGEPLPLLFLYRSMLNSDDAEASARILAKVGNPSTPQLLKALRSGAMVRRVWRSGASDEQQTAFWAWVAERIDPDTLMTEIRQQRVNTNAGPKLKEFLDELAAHKADLRADTSAQ